MLSDTIFAYGSCGSRRLFDAENNTTALRVPAVRLQCGGRANGATLAEKIAGDDYRFGRSAHEGFARKSPCGTRPEQRPTRLTGHRKSTSLAITGAASGVDRAKLPPKSPQLDGANKPC